MQLLTAELRAQLPGIYSQVENRDPIVYTKFFIPKTRRVWFVIEGQEHDEGFTFFGYAKGRRLELKFFSMKTLLALSAAFGLPIQRDLRFTPAPWSEVKQREGLEDKARSFEPSELSPTFNWKQPLLWQRTPAGLKTNVPWLVKHHSPTGFEIGYAGSGPSDFALNAMATLFPCNGERVERCFEGAVSREAWLLHQRFKFAFLATADRSGGRIEWETIAAWLNKERQNDHKDNGA
ncbi:MAG: DUF2958 domain-containing protein [Acidobacteria bacterium]|nr:DUF2958 domain-containing protein [Acidobacteriota bacterium]